MQSRFARPEEPPSGFPRVNWKLLVPLGLAGVVPPLATYAFGGSPVVSALLWTALAALLWVPAVLRAKDPTPFLTLLATGLVAGVAAGLVDVAMLGDPMLLAFAVTIGAVWGALFGGVAVGVKKWRAGRGA